MQQLEKSRQQTARHLLSMGLLTDEQIAEVVELTPEQIQDLKQEPH